jgi:hypothetical protein
LDLSSNSLVCDVTSVKASEVSGKFEKGGTVQYQGAALVITYVNSDGSVDLRDTRGLMSLANAIQDMGSLVSLNLAKNELGVEGATRVAGVLPKW